MPRLRYTAVIEQGFVEYEDAILPVKEYHCGDKTILRPSYIHNRISYTGRTSRLYWARALVSLGTTLNAIGNGMGNVDAI